MAERYSPDWLVVVGSSAGGIESLSKLVASLPSGFPVPLIIAQHLHPANPSHLQEILQSRTPLPIRVIEGRVDLEPGTIFIAGPNTHIEITDHNVSEINDDGERPMPSVDLLFRTATTSFGERVVAVILSGTGSDGALGSRIVKEAGGIVIIEDPQTSAFPQMALAVPPTIVDLSVQPDTIGPLLYDLVTGGYTIDPQEQRTDMEHLIAEVHERSGIDFSKYKATTMTRRLQQRLVATKSQGLDEYRTYLQENPDEYQILANSFLIQVTEFFRDPELFEHLLSGGLEPVIDRALETGELRIWSAGCATGEEAYSLAIVIHELLGDRLGHVDVDVRVFGTDVDADAIAFARQGIYPATSLSSLPQPMIDRYFNRQDDLFEVRQSIRSLVVFGEHDLAQRSPFPRIDLVVCRNVLIYFTSDLQRRVLQLFAFALRDQGMLILGKAETVSPLPDYFSMVNSQLKIYRRSGKRTFIPVGHFSDVEPRANRQQGLSRTPLIPSHHAARSESSRQHQDGRLENVLRALPVGALLVDRQYHISFANPAVREHLGIHSASTGDDLMHIAQHPSLTTLRSAIDSALRGETTTTDYRLDLPSNAADEVRHHIEFSCVPFSRDQDPESIDYALILTTNITALTGLRQDLDEANARLQRLTNSHRSLELANERLTQANQQLHVRNEELLISNEEFQAAAEEVETLNEELQATNEELETLNEELQATIEELRTTNEELHARTRELEQVAAEREEAGSGHEDTG